MADLARLATEVIVDFPEYDGFILGETAIPSGFPFPPPQKEVNSVQEKVNQVKVNQVKVKVNQVEPKANPVQTKPNPVQSKPNPVQTKQNPVQTKQNPVQSKPNPVQSKQNPVQSKQNPVQSKPNPVQTKPNPIQSKANPVQSKPVQTPSPPPESDSLSPESDSSPPEFPLQNVKIPTRHYQTAFDSETADFAYTYLVNTIEWEDGVKSRRTGFTRKAKAINFQSDEVVQNLILGAIGMIDDPGNRDVVNSDQTKPSFAIGGIYLNYYRDGNDYTPSHSHETCQLIISLGATRTLRVGNTDLKSGHGDIIVFGRSLHGVPKEPEVKEGRISIAVFLL